MTRKLYRLRLEPNTIEAVVKKAKEDGRTQTAVMESGIRKEVGLPPVGAETVKQPRPEPQDQTCCPTECCDNCDENCCAVKVEGGPWTKDCGGSGSHCSKSGRCHAEPVAQPPAREESDLVRLFDDLVKDEAEFRPDRPEQEHRRRAVVRLLNQLGIRSNNSNYEADSARVVALLDRLRPEAKP